MTRLKLARALLQNIERARRALDEGPPGYVLHTGDCLQFICVRPDGTAVLDEPLDPDVVVVTSLPQATTLRRYWNSLCQGDRFATVVTSLRREALASYIEVLQETFDAFLLKPDNGATQ